MKVTLVIGGWYFILPAVVVGQAVSPAANSPATAGSESLGSQLLEDLPTTVVPNKPPPQTDKTSPPSMEPIDDAGEDIGGPSGPLLMSRVRSGMRRAEMLLGRSAAEANTTPLQQAGEAQKRVVAQLDELIAELCKQCQGGQGQSTDNPPPQPSRRSAAKPSQPSRTATTSKAPAHDSSDPLNRAGAEAVDKGDVDELVKHLWGHLPERSREQVLQSFSDEFLPKYETEIEQYYRRLSEDPRETPQ
jgi:hypothetical protein